LSLSIENLVSKPAFKLYVHRYFGETLRRQRADLDGYDLVMTQNMSMQLYERRIASLQRFVAMCVIFHTMGRRVVGLYTS
jgi:hypothetical protein